MSHVPWHCLVGGAILGKVTPSRVPKKYRSNVECAVPMRIRFEAIESVLEGIAHGAGFDRQGSRPLL